MMWNGGYGMMWGDGWGFGPLQILLPLVVFVLVVGFIVSIFTRGSPRRGDTRGNGRSAGLTILEERYGRGEIGRDEYLEKKRDLLA